MATLYGDITSVEYQDYIIGGHPLRVPILNINTQGTVNIGDSITATNVNSYKFIWGCMGLAYNTLYTIPANEKLYNRSNNGYIQRTGNQIKICKANDTVITTVSMVSAGNYGSAGRITILKLLDGFMFPVIQSTMQGNNKNNFDTNWNVLSFDLFPIIEQKNADKRVYGTYYSEYAELMNFLNGSEAPTDPYSGAGDSGTGGGDGTFDGSSDPVPIPALPNVGATDSGFITLFAPTTNQLKALAYYMWVNPLFDPETGFKKIFSDPMDCILGLSVVPVSVPVSHAQNVTVGNLVTSVSMNVAVQQYIEVDCGSVDFTRKYFGSYLDYEPYTKMALFVPYSGIHAINADDIMGRVVHLKYHIDILTGSLVAFLLCGNSVLYEFNGACASNIPVNSINYASTIENAIRIAVNIGTTVATAGAAAPATTATTAARQSARAIASSINLAGSTAEGALSMKPGIDRAGSLGGTTGLMGNQTPYFIITRPRLCVPKNQNKYKGYPSFIQCKLSDLEGKGYTELDTVVLSGLYLTENEKDELIGILKGGVYL